MENMTHTVQVLPGWSKGYLKFRYPLVGVNEEYNLDAH
jgi:hypothetical protein